MSIRHRPRSPSADAMTYQPLWHAAADGLDADGTIWNALRWALEDPDDRIAELAERAMAGLMALEDRKSEMEFR